MTDTGPSSHPPSTGSHRCRHARSAGAIPTPTQHRVSLQTDRHKTGTPAVRVLGRFSNSNGGVLILTPPGVLRVEVGWGAERDRNPFCRLIENFCSGLRSGTSTAGGPRLQLSSCTAPTPGGARGRDEGMTGWWGG